MMNVSQTIKSNLRRLQSDIRKKNILLHGRIGDFLSSMPDDDMNYKLVRSILLQSVLEMSKVPIYVYETINLVIVSCGLKDELCSEDVDLDPVYSPRVFVDGLASAVVDRLSVETDNSIQIRILQVLSHVVCFLSGDVLFSVFYGVMLCMRTSTNMSLGVCQSLSRQIVCMVFDRYERQVIDITSKTVKASDVEDLCKKIETIEIQSETKGDSEKNDNQIFCEDGNIDTKKNNENNIKTCINSEILNDTKILNNISIDKETLNNTFNAKDTKNNKNLNNIGIDKETLINNNINAKDNKNRKTLHNIGINKETLNKNISAENTKNNENLNNIGIDKETLNNIRIDKETLNNNINAKDIKNSETLNNIGIDKETSNNNINAKDIKNSETLNNIGIDKETSNNNINAKDNKNSVTLNNIGINKETLNNNILAENTKNNENSNNIGINEKTVNNNINAKDSNSETLYSIGINKETLKNDISAKETSNKKCINNNAEKNIPQKEIYINNDIYLEDCKRMLSNIFEVIYTTKTPALELVLFGITFDFLEIALRFKNIYLYNSSLTKILRSSLPGLISKDKKRVNNIILLCLREKFILLEDVLCSMMTGLSNRKWGDKKSDNSLNISDAFISEDLVVKFDKDIIRNISKNQEIIEILFLSITKIMDSGSEENKVMILENVYEYVKEEYDSTKLKNFRDKNDNLKSIKHSQIQDVKDNDYQIKDFKDKNDNLKSEKHSQIQDVKDNDCKIKDFKDENDNFKLDNYTQIQNVKDKNDNIKLENYSTDNIKGNDSKIDNDLESHNNKNTNMFKESKNILQSGECLYPHFDDYATPGNGFENNHFFIFLVDTVIQFLYKKYSNENVMYPSFVYEKKMDLTFNILYTREETVLIEICTFITPLIVNTANIETLFKAMVKNRRLVYGCSQILLENKKSINNEWGIIFNVAPDRQSVNMIIEKSKEFTPEQLLIIFQSTTNTEILYGLFDSNKERNKNIIECFIYFMKVLYRNENEVLCKIIEEFFDCTNDDMERLCEVSSFVFLEGVILKHDINTVLRKIEEYNYCRSDNYDDNNIEKNHCFYNDYVNTEYLNDKFNGDKHFINENNNYNESDKYNKMDKNHIYKNSMVGNGMYNQCNYDATYNNFTTNNKIYNNSKNYNEGDNKCNYDATYNNFTTNNKIYNNSKNYNEGDNKCNYDAVYNNSTISNKMDNNSKNDNELDNKCNYDAVYNYSTTSNKMDNNSKNDNELDNKCNYDNEGDYDVIYNNCKIGNKMFDNSIVGNEMDNDIKNNFTITSDHNKEIIKDNNDFKNENKIVFVNNKSVPILDSCISNNVLENNNVKNMTVYDNTANIGLNNIQRKSIESNNTKNSEDITICARIVSLIINILHKHPHKITYSWKHILKIINEATSFTEEKSQILSILQMICENHIQYMKNDLKTVFLDCTMKYVYFISNDMSTRLRILSLLNDGGKWFTKECLMTYVYIIYRTGMMDPENNLNIKDEICTNSNYILFSDINEKHNKGWNDVFESSLGIINKIKDNNKVIRCLFRKWINEISKINVFGDGDYEIRDRNRETVVITLNHLNKFINDNINIVNDNFTHDVLDKNNCVMNISDIGNITENQFHSKNNYVMHIKDKDNLIENLFHDKDNYAMNINDKDNLIENQFHSKSNNVMNINDIGNITEKQFHSKNSYVMNISDKDNLMENQFHSKSNNVMNIRDKEYIIENKFHDKNSYVMNMSDKDNLMENQFHSKNINVMNINYKENITENQFHSKNSYVMNISYKDNLIENQFHSKSNNVMSISDKDSISVSQFIENQLKHKKNIENIQDFLELLLFYSRVIRNIICNEIDIKLRGNNKWKNEIVLICLEGLKTTLKSDKQIYFEILEKIPIKDDKTPYYPIKIYKELLEISEQISDRNSIIILLNKLTRFIFMNIKEINETILKITKSYNNEDVFRIYNLWIKVCRDKKDVISVILDDINERIQNGLSFVESDQDYIKDNIIHKYDYEKYDMNLNTDSKDNNNFKQNDKGEIMYYKKIEDNNNSEKFNDHENDLSIKKIDDNNNYKKLNNNDYDSSIKEIMDNNDNYKKFINNENDSSIKEIEENNNCYKNFYDYDNDSLTKKSGNNNSNNFSEYENDMQNKNIDNNSKLSTRYKDNSSFNIKSNFKNIFKEIMINITILNKTENYWDKSIQCLLSTGDKIKNNRELTCTYINCINEIFKEQTDQVSKRPGIETFYGTIKGTISKNDSNFIDKKSVMEQRRRENIYIELINDYISTVKPLMYEKIEEKTQIGLRKNNKLKLNNQNIIYDNNGDQIICVRNNENSDFEKRNIINEIQSNVFYSLNQYKPIKNKNICQPNNSNDIQKNKNIFNDQNMSIINNTLIGVSNEHVENNINCLNTNNGDMYKSVNNKHVENNINCFDTNRENMHKSVSNEHVENNINCLNTNIENNHKSKSNENVGNKIEYFNINRDMINKNQEMIKPNKTILNFNTDIDQPVYDKNQIYSDCDPKSEIEKQVFNNDKNIDRHDDQRSVVENQNSMYDKISDRSVNQRSEIQKDSISKNNDFIHMHDKKTGSSFIRDQSPCSTNNIKTSLQKDQNEKIFTLINNLTYLIHDSEENLKYRNNLANTCLKIMFKNSRFCSEILVKRIKEILNEYITHEKIYGKRIIGNEMDLVFIALQGISINIGIVKNLKEEILDCLSVRNSVVVGMVKEILKKGL